VVRSRLFSIAAKVIKAPVTEKILAKPFESIPGPLRLPFIGSLYIYHGTLGKIIIYAIQILNIEMHFKK